MECSESLLYEKIFFVTASIITLAGSLIVIIVILYQGLYCSYSFKILLFISINDLIRGVFGICLILLNGSETFCMIIGYALNSFAVSNFVWALCLTYTIYLIIVKEEFDFTKHHKKWVLASYPATFILEAIPFTTSSFDFHNGFCGLRENLIGSIWRFGVYYSGLFVTLGLIIYMFVRIKKKIETIGNLSINSVIFERGLVYSIIIAVVELPIFFVRVIQLFYSSCGLVVSLDIFLTLFLLQGLGNTAVFLLNKTVRNSVWTKRRECYESSVLKGTLNISFRSTFS